MIDRPLAAEREELVALTEATGFFHPDEVQIVREMFDDFVEHPTSDEYTWLVYREQADGAPLGFACYGPASIAVGTYELYWIVVAREHQANKIGTALLSAVETDLAGRRARQLYVETSDTSRYTPTRAFYERRGYACVAHFRDFYSPGDGKVIYFKDISKQVETG